MVALLVIACSSPSPAPGVTGPASAAEPTAQAPAAGSTFAATHVLVAWSGATSAGPEVTRTEDEARELAEAVWVRASAGEPLEALARSTSDGPQAARGGRIGVYRAGTLVPEFEQAVAAVAIGELTKPFRTTFGWHVVRRDPVVEIRARQVLVSFDGAWRSDATRTREQARARIDEVLAKLTAGADFAAVAREYSEDPSAVVGGDLGRIAPGQLVPAFEDAAFALDPGARSGVVETPYGFHVIERLPDP